MKQYVRDAIFEELEKYCILSGEGGYIEVTEWKNSEGFDINVYTKDNNQYFHLTWGQWKLLKKMVKKMDLTV